MKLPNTVFIYTVHTILCLILNLICHEQATLPIAIICPRLLKAHYFSLPSHILNCFNSHRTVRSLQVPFRMRSRRHPREVEAFHRTVVQWFTIAADIGCIYNRVEKHQHVPDIFFLAPAVQSPFHG